MPEDVPLDVMGGPTRVPIGGKTFTLSPLNIADMKAIQGRIRDGWLDNLDNSKIDARAHMGLRATLLTKPMPMADVYQEIESPYMWPMILYLATYPNDKSVTEEWFKNAIDNMTEADMEICRKGMERAMSVGGSEDDQSDFTQPSSESTGHTQSPS